MKAVILAGGQGRRLSPFTNLFPKPMMPIGTTPILEILILQLKKHGFIEFILATGYLEEIIRSYFRDGEEWGVNIRYSKEDSPLGTAGPLDLLRDQLTETFLLINGDIATDLDFYRFRSCHAKEGNTATIGLTKRSVNIDFGVVRLAPTNDFLAWEEKPTVHYLVSAGIYLFEPEALDSLPRNTLFNLPDFVEALHRDNHQVRGFIHEGYWLDIGRPEDYERACRDWEARNS